MAIKKDGQGVQNRERRESLLSPSKRATGKLRRQEMTSRPQPPAVLHCSPLTLHPIVELKIHFSFCTRPLHSCPIAVNSTYSEHCISLQVTQNRTLPNNPTGAFQVARCVSSSSAFSLRSYSQPSMRYNRRKRFSLPIRLTHQPRKSTRPSPH